jgi:hypothetical protein
MIFFQDGYGQERVSFHTVKQPCVVTSTPTVTAKLSASFKRISPKSPVQDGSSSSDDTESDEQKPQVLYLGCVAGHLSFSQWNYVLLW